jgi:hypothetical protein
MPTVNTAAPMTTRAGRLVIMRFVLGTSPPASRASTTNANESYVGKQASLTSGLHPCIRRAKSARGASESAGLDSRRAIAATTLAARAHR